ALDVMGRLSSMVATALGLLLFPAMMALAASSDLLTMTISNRVSATLIVGFFVLALIVGMSSSAMLWHVGAGCTVLVVAFTCFAMGWIGGGVANLRAEPLPGFGLGTLPPFFFYARLLVGARCLCPCLFP